MKYSTRMLKRKPRVIRLAGSHRRPREFNLPTFALLAENCLYRCDCDRNQTLRTYGNLIVSCVYPCVVSKEYAIFWTFK